MKIRNKKTGEIKNVNHNHILMHFNDGESKCINSLAELNDEWEDYEEPKEHWFVDSGGEVEEATYLTENDKANLANFGNYFETKEEAEKAVEKLKTWKRLKDNGIMFKGWGWDKGLGNYVVLGSKDADYVPDEIGLSGRKDLDLLFGGEE